MTGPTLDAIRNCAVKFRQVCPQVWDRLAATARDGVRHCATCQQEVFYCATDAEAVTHAMAGHCIAKPMPDPSGLQVHTVLGRPSAPRPRPTEDERQRQEEYQRENAKTSALRDADSASGLCPDCGYPCPERLRTCGVCGRRLRAPRRRVPVTRRRG